MFQVSGGDKRHETCQLPQVGDSSVTHTPVPVTHTPVSHPHTCQLLTHLSQSPILSVNSCLFSFYRVVDFGASSVYHTHLPLSISHSTILFFASAIYPTHPLSSCPFCTWCAFPHLSMLIFMVHI